MDLTIVAVYTICDDLWHWGCPEAAGILLKPLRKKNSKRQYPAWEVYLQQVRGKRVETSNSLIEQFLPKSIHAVTVLGFELKGFSFLIATNIKQLFT